MKKKESQNNEGKIPSVKEKVAQAISERAYRSSISESAREKIIEKHKNGNSQYVDYDINGVQVGRRVYAEDGHLEWEYGLKDGKHHGYYYYFHPNGEIQYIAHFRNGKQNGLASQWDDKGNLMGFSVYQKGTGLELWFGEYVDDSGIQKVHLAEERSFKDGQRHGFERCWNGCDLEINRESHYKNGQLHGIVREWETKGLMDGFPKFYLEDIKVTAETYIQSRINDPNLPEYIKEDDNMRRNLPDTYVAMRKVIKD